MQSCLEQDQMVSSDRDIEKPGFSDRSSEGVGSGLVSKSGSTAISENPVAY